MREKFPSAALLRQVRAWQKAVLMEIKPQISLQNSPQINPQTNGQIPHEPESNLLEPLKVVRHLILILFVVRMLEQRHSGLISGLFSDATSGKIPGATSGANMAPSRSRKLSRTESFPEPLKNLQQEQLIYPRLVRLWRSLQPLFVGLPAKLELLPDLLLPDRLLRSILRRLEMAPLEIVPLEIAQNYAVPNYADPNHTDPNPFGLFCASLLGQVYETLLIDPTPEKPSHRTSSRKAQGIYYTPAPIVKFMVQQTIDRLLEFAGTEDSPLGAAPRGQTAVDQLPRLLDPACGGGAFLLEAYQRLLDWQLQRLVTHSSTKQDGLGQDELGQDGLVRDESGRWQLSWTMRQQVLQHCIYGVDLDPEAVTIAQISLWLKLLEGTLPNGSPDSLDKLPKLNGNLQVGNALLDEDAVPSQNSLNWEQAFPAVMRSGGFDGVIGNPPYLDSEQMMQSCPTWRPYCTTRYETAIGNWDLFCVFVEKALMLCRSGGMTSLIVPNKLASAPYAAKTRSLLMRHRLLFLRDYAQVSLFAASVYPLVYGVQKALPSQNPVRYEVMGNLTDIRRSGWLSQNVESSEACWQFAESAVHAQLIQRLQQFPTLETIAQVYGAATVGEAYRLQPWLQECDTPIPEDFRFINSGTIDRYTFRWGKKPTRYLGQIYQHPVLKGDRLQYLPVRRQQQAQQPKIIVAGLSQQLECVLDETGNLLPGKSTCIVLDLPEAIDWRYLLALLNSRLLTVHLRDYAGGNQLQGGYLRIGTAQLKQLPIALPDFTQAIDRQCYTEIIELVQSSLATNSSRFTGSADNLINSQTEITPKTDLQIEERIAHLYRLTDEEENVITHTSIQQGQ
ncbi:Eco57I restriction-modification methylase domain-containing protein [Leptolyngbya ohadii]|uniref:Eco57I restriction-modification methylase domain-containing protein n=1 Tax=Leptolyngbya ohadii TaxID=1962290 RepID=UPI000B5987CF|nr:DNA methyltransferase [Leptolyngbya ohadii]